MSYTYSQYQNYLATLMATTTADTFFVSILPEIIDYAEQRIYREMQLLNTVTKTNVTGAVGGRSLNLPASQIVLNRINLFSSGGTTGPRVQLYPVSPDYMDAVYNDATVLGPPVCFSLQTQATANLGPTPDQAYTFEVVGTSRPTPLSASNTSTLLTNGLPDLFLAASMIFAAGYQKNFGAQADDPQMAQSWETQYEKLLASAMTEENLKKFWGASWTSSPTSPTADKQRG